MHHVLLSSIRWDNFHLYPTTSTHTQQHPTPQHPTPQHPHPTIPHLTTPPPHNYWYLLTQILCIIFKYSLGRLFCGAINAYATRVSAYFLFLNFYFLMYGPKISIQIKFCLFTFPPRHVMISSDGVRGGIRIEYARSRMGEVK